MEKIIRDKLLKHCQDNNIITTSQYGFLPKRCVEYNLLHSTDIITSLLDNNIPVDVFYLDFSKAFDCIPHSLLLAKLRRYNVSSYFLSFIEAWLTDRTQFVKYESSKSVAAPVISGVPQGTVLGPLLFIIFITDLMDVIIHNIALLYADDGKIISPIRSITDYHNLLSDIGRISEWCTSNGMKLSFNKCSILHLGKNNPRHTYTLNNITISEPANVRDIGVIIDQSAGFKDHIRKIVSTASARMNRLNRTFRYKPNTFKLTLYKIFVRPLLESAISVWTPHTAKQSKLVESVQKRLLLYGLNYNTSSYINFACRKGRYRKLLSEYNLVTLNRRRVVADLCMLFKILHKLADSSYLASLFTFNARIGKDHKIIVLGSKHEFRRSHFTIRSIKLWNELPDHISQSTTLCKFRICVNNHFDQIQFV
jgi:hypothetical protein